MPPGPRARRVRVLKEGLRSSWSVTQFPPNVETAGAAEHTRIAAGQRPRLVRKAPRAARLLRRSTLIDHYEVEAWRAFRSFQPEAELALLVGYPFTPVIAAARRLRRLGIPYVVDLGDPISLAPTKEWVCRIRGAARVRAARAERTLWEGAVGAILTSERLATTIGDAFPFLQVLVRPNGYEPIVGPDSRSVRTQDDVLRLVHFGTLSEERVDIRPFLSRLAASGRWSEVRFDQFGAVFDVEVAAPGVRTTFRREVPWEEAVTEAPRYDAAVVVANTSGLGPPSKVFSYMSLPVPRIALVASADMDETAQYVRPLQSWLVVEAGELEPAGPVAAHVARAWSEHELLPPAHESWPAVVQTVNRFLLQFAPGGAARAVESE